MDSVQVEEPAVEVVEVLAAGAVVGPVAEAAVVLEADRAAELAAVAAVGLVVELAAEQQSKNSHITLSYDSRQR